MCKYIKHLALFEKKNFLKLACTTSTLETFLLNKGISSHQVETKIKQNVQRFISKSANLEGSLTLLALVFCATGTEGSTLTVGVLLTAAFPGLGVCPDNRGSRGISL